MLLPHLRDLKNPQATIEKNKTYLARVVNNNDPSKLGRVQIRIAKLHRGVSDSDLPYASPLTFSLQGNNQTGSLNIPVNGSTVVVEYFDDYSIFYKGSFYSSSSVPSELTSSGYPNCYGFVDASGNKLIVNTQIDTFTFTHLSGTTFSITQDGSVLIQSGKTLKIEADKIEMKATTDIAISSANLNIDTSASINLKSLGNILIQGGSVLLTSAAAVTMNAANFILNAVFNLVPLTGWVTPPAAQATPSTASVTPPVAPTPRTKPTITGFTNQTDY
jgi:hypothetical protein